MCKMVKIFTFIFCFTFIGCYVHSEKLVLCYYGTWATYRPSLGKFDIKNIKPELCTHLVYTFAGVEQDGTITFLDPNLDLTDWGKGNIEKFNALKKSYPTLKTLLAVGGWNQASGRFSIMANNPAFRQNFVNNAIDILLKYNFDGLDVDWEYPNRRDTVYGGVDIDNFTQLLKELRDAFDKHGLLVTAATASVPAMASLSYNIPAICKYLDLISIMTYDLRGPWDPVTGHNAALHSGQRDINVHKDEVYTVDVAVQYWLEQGCPPEKMLLGLPLYGRTFTLANVNESQVGAPSTGEGIAGPYTRQNGILGYNEICVNLQSQQWDIHWDNDSKVPYAVQGRNWLSYDNIESLELKVQFAKKYKLKGIMVWSIETDDFRGLCQKEDYPLLRSINNVLGRIVKEITTTKPIGSTTTSGQPTLTTPDPIYPTSEPSYFCKSEGLTADPEDCTGFYNCITDVDGTLIPRKMKCPNNLYFDPKHLFCNYPDLVDCYALN